MKYRNYVMLKSPDNRVLLIYIGPQPTAENIASINSALERVTTDLYKHHFAQGYDILIGNALNLRSLKSTLPELSWSKAQTKQLCEA